MDDFPNLKNPFHFLATLGGIGNIPLAPGTFGSIFSWLIFIFLIPFCEHVICNLHRYFSIYLDM